MAMKTTQMFWGELFYAAAIVTKVGLKVIAGVLIIALTAASAIVEISFKAVETLVFCTPFPLLLASLLGYVVLTVATAPVRIGLRLAPEVLRRIQEMDVQQHSITSEPFQKAESDNCSSVKCKLAKALNLTGDKKDTFFLNYTQEKKNVSKNSVALFWGIFAKSTYCPKFCQKDDKKILNNEEEVVGVFNILSKLKTSRTPTEFEGGRPIFCSCKNKGEITLIPNGDDNDDDDEGTGGWAVTNCPVGRYPHNAVYNYKDKDSNQDVSFKGYQLGNNGCEDCLQLCERKFDQMCQADPEEGAKTTTATPEDKDEPIFHRSHFLGSAIYLLCHRMEKGIDAECQELVEEHLRYFVDKQQMRMIKEVAILNKLKKDKKIPVEDISTVRENLKDLGFDDNLLDELNFK